MNNLQEKLSQLKWLQHAGIEYYCSEKKDSKNSLMQKLKEENKRQKAPKQEIGPIKEKSKVPIVVEQTKKELNLDNSEIRKLVDKASNLKELKSIVENFDGCSLKNFATNVVFSDGVADAKIMLIGEAPGAKEDEQGIPFCGESGILLDKMLETIGLDRKKNVYITNTIFWRPPANRRPTQEEIEICKPFVEKHIELLAPSLIILIGGTATASLLGKKENISDIKESYYSYTNQYLKDPIPVTALFHPAFLLRQPSKKKDTWYDLLKIRDFLEKESII